MKFVEHQAAPTNDLTELAPIVGYGFVNMITLYIPCYYCTELEGIMDDLSDGLLHSKWYKMNQIDKRNYMITMSMTRSIMAFRLLKMFTFNLEYFVNVLKFACSVYAVMKDVNNQNA